MRIYSPFTSYTEAVRLLTRSAGYIKIFDRRTQTESFVRPLRGVRYPRFHIYIEQKETNIVLNLHLDQKQPSYSETHSHNAEYDGPVVKEEENRIRALWQVEHETTQKKTPLQKNHHTSMSWWEKIFSIKK